MKRRTRVSRSLTSEEKETLAENVKKLRGLQALLDDVAYGMRLRISDQSPQRRREYMDVLNRINLLNIQVTHAFNG